MVWIIGSFFLAVQYGWSNLPWKYTIITYQVHCKNGNTYVTNNSELGYENNPSEYDPSTDGDMSDKMALKCGYTLDQFIHAVPFVLHVQDNAKSLFQEKTIRTENQEGSYTEDVLISIGILALSLVVLFCLRRIVFYILYGQSFFTKVSLKNL